MLEVYIGSAQHGQVAATVQAFINVYTGERVDVKELEGRVLHHTFTDSFGRQVMMFRSV
ncbi:hypothetical protein [Bacillus cereus group sp. Bce040]|uniref:hypothetical protein n=1 Tax=Bacillus cereus group sp. Bce040 TaxID=3445229 RepID=UPI003F204379